VAVDRPFFKVQARNAFLNALGFHSGDKTANWMELPIDAQALVENRSVIAPIRAGKFGRRRKKRRLSLLSPPPYQVRPITFAGGTLAQKVGREGVKLGRELV